MRGTKNGHRGLSAAILLIGGGAVAGAAWAGGHPGVAAIMRGGSDERQRAMDLRATAAAGSVTALFTVVAAIVNIARTGGDPGAYGAVCVVFGISYGVALAVVRRRA